MLRRKTAPAPAEIYIPSDHIPDVGTNVGISAHNVKKSLPKPIVGIIRWRSGRDSNPRYGFSTVQRFSKPPPSASRPPLQMKKLQPRHYQFPFTLRQVIELETRVRHFRRSCLSLRANRCNPRLCKLA